MPTSLPPAANIFIGSLIFIEELAEKIVAAVGPVRDSLDACLIFPSMPAVMKLNKLGTFAMSQVRGRLRQEGNGCCGWLRLRRPRKPGAMLPGGKRTLSATELGWVRVCDNCTKHAQPSES
jgi:hypothetical protein